MPTLSFFPWMTISEPIQAGQFRIISCGSAQYSGAIPAELHEAVAAVLVPYGKTRRVDRDRVPLLWYGEAGIVDDPSDPVIGRCFEFRQRVAFALLAARRFFSHRYANGDNAQLVVQRFSPEHAGGAVVTSRRRDGVTNNIIPKGHLRVRRPEHVSGWCEIPRDLDVPLLEALERAEAAPISTWPQLADAIRLFVGANTDSPDIGTHNELVDLVSAFSRLANAWSEDDTVNAFIAALPSPAPLPMDETDQRPVAAPGFGPKLTDTRMTKGLAKRRTVREIWLRDAYVLRGQLGHGHVAISPYPSLWTVHEHLLLGATILPLYVKRILAAADLYHWTREDQELDEVFDALATVEPFAPGAGEDDDSEDDEDGVGKTHPWREVFNRASMRRLAKLLYTEWDKIESSQLPAITPNDVDPSNT